MSIALDPTSRGVVPGTKNQVYYGIPFTVTLSTSDRYMFGFWYYNGIPGASGANILSNT
jgi:hypothetical protein